MGLERTRGFQTVAFCEIDKFCQKVLRKHWPSVPLYEDIRELTRSKLDADGIGVDAICGGFPCQDISIAGKGAGIKAERSGLWSEYARIIGELGPKYVIVENVAALLGRGLGDILGDLAALGYDAEWHCIPASYVGAPHRRDRVWVVAYPKCMRRRQSDREISSDGFTFCETEREESSFWIGSSSENVAHAYRKMLEGQRLARRIPKERDSFSGSSWWGIEPDVGRVAHGVPSRVDRLKGLGNAVVPQIPEIIGRSILSCT